MHQHEYEAKAMAALQRVRESGSGVKIGAVVVCTLLCSGLLPGVPILIGVLLMLAVALHTWTPDLQPYLQPILRVPVAAAATRRARLVLIAAVGGLLVVSGAVGATTRGHLRSRWEQDDRRREVAEQDAERLMGRVEDHLAGGDVLSAELALMDAERIADMDPERREQFAQLLERVRRSGDGPAILAVLVGLTPEAFSAFETSQRLPPQFEFPERALTMRAVAIALEQLPEARKRRAGR
jgi:hypothetical protein